MSDPKDLYEFLLEAELEHYLQPFKNDLKVTKVSMLKYVEDDELLELGMSKPEVRRLKKFYHREFPQGALGKIKKHIMAKAGMEQTSRPTSPHPEPAPRSGKPSRHIIPYDAITVCKTLGTGEFGTVQQGVWINDAGERHQVAIKCLSKEKMDNGISDFLKEASIMHSIDTDHVVRMYGVVFDRDSLMLVTELAPLRSLLECLKEPSLKNSFPVSKLSEFCHQIAAGMLYLETKRLVHRDLAARNVLVFTKDKVKISDFGLSRSLGAGKDYYQTNFSVSLKLPIAWCAPECITYLKFTSASDVWAYGVTLWEMFSYGFQPWAAFTGQQILETIDKPSSQRLEQPDCCPKDFYKLMQKCWNHEPKDRPSFVEICKLVPQLKPSIVQAKRDCSVTGQRTDYLPYKVDDIITILDTQPENVPAPSVWKGVMGSGKTGLLNSQDVEPYMEINTYHATHSPLMRNSQRMTRRDGSRRSAGKGKKNPLHAGLISMPQNDLRHTGHVGFDGTLFGDVAFIGDNYDKLPVKVVNPYKPQDDVCSTTSSSATTPSECSDLEKSVAPVQYVIRRSLLSAPTDGDTSNLKPVANNEESELSVKTANSMDTFTSVSSMATTSSAPIDPTKPTVDYYEQLDDSAFESLEDFTLPELSTSLSLDMGPSFMDEFMKSFNEKPQTTGNDLQATSPEADVVTLTSDDPLVESHKVASNGHSPDMNETVSSGFQEDYVSLNGNAISPRANKGPANSTKKKKKSFLRIDDDETETIPLIDSAFHRSPNDKKGNNLKPMSATQEKQMNEALLRIDKYAQESLQSQMTPKTPHSDGGGINDEDQESSPKSKSFFRLSRGKSPKVNEVEKPTFSDGITPTTSDLSENVSPEAQEAYNVLIASNTFTKSDSKENTTLNGTRHSNISRTTTTHSTTVTSTANIRKPRGIPGRGPMASTWRSEVNQGKGNDVGTNPLRRLRDSQASGSMLPRPSTTVHSTSTSAGSRSRPRSAEASDLSSCDVSSLSSASTTASTSNTQLPQVPPRQPLKQSTINTKPRERQHPLDLSHYKTPPTRTTTAVTKKTRSVTGGSKPEVKHSSSLVGKSSEILTNTNSNSNIPANSKVAFNGKSVNKPESFASQGIRPMEPPVTLGIVPLAVSASERSVKNIQCNIAELGLHDDEDLFWKESPEDLHPSKHTNPTSTTECLGEQVSPMEASYTNSDSVSYEDLLEFALDGGLPSSQSIDQFDQSNARDQCMCDEVRIMRKVFTKQVTVEDCLMALDDTQWHVHKAIKYIKLKQLLAASLGTVEQCKRALLTCHWQVDQAAAILLTHSPNSHTASPDCVEV